MYEPDVLQLACAGIAHSCDGNEYTNPYRLALLTPAGTVLDPARPPLNFAIRQDEVVVLVSRTAPPAADLSFRSFVLLQRFSLWEYSYEEAGAKYPETKVRDVRPATWLDESFVGIQEDRDVLGESRDTVYLRNEGTFTLADDEFVIVCGVNRERTGKATCSSFSDDDEVRACPYEAENSRRVAGSAIDEDRPRLPRVGLRPHPAVHPGRARDHRRDGHRRRHEADGPSGSEDAPHPLPERQRREEEAGEIGRVPAQVQPERRAGGASLVEKKAGPPPSPAL